MKINVNKIFGLFWIWYRWYFTIFFLFSKISSSILSLPQFFLLAGMRKGHKCKNINLPWKPLPTKDGILIAPFPWVYLFHQTIATSGTVFSAQLMVTGSPRASNVFLTLNLAKKITSIVFQYICMIYDLFEADSMLW